MLQSHLLKQHHLHKHKPHSHMKPLNCNKIARLHLLSHMQQSYIHCYYKTVICPRLTLKLLCCSVFLTTFLSSKHYVIGLHNAIYLRQLLQGSRRLKSFYLRTFVLHHCSYLTFSTQLFCQFYLLKMADLLLFQ